MCKEKGRRRKGKQDKRETWEKGKMIKGEKGKRGNMGNGWKWKKGKQMTKRKKHKKAKGLQTCICISLHPSACPSICRSASLQSVSVRVSVLNHVSILRVFLYLSFCLSVSPSVCVRVLLFICSWKCPYVSVLLCALASLSLSLPVPSSMSICLSSRTLSG